jgi:hypothetical protein
MTRCSLGVGHSIVFHDVALHKSEHDISTSMPFTQAHFSFQQVQGTSVIQKYVLVRIQFKSQNVETVII